MSKKKTLLQYFLISCCIHLSSVLTKFPVYLLLIPPKKNIRDSPPCFTEAFQKLWAFLWRFCLAYCRLAVLWHKCSTGFLLANRLCNPFFFKCLLILYFEKVTFHFSVKKPVCQLKLFVGFWELFCWSTLPWLCINRTPYFPLLHQSLNNTDSILSGL